MQRWFIRISRVLTERCSRYGRLLLFLAHATSSGHNHNRITVTMLPYRHRCTRQAYLLSRCTGTVCRARAKAWRLSPKPSFTHVSRSLAWRSREHGFRRPTLPSHSCPQLSANAEFFGDCRLQRSTVVHRCPLRWLSDWLALFATLLTSTACCEPFIIVRGGSQQGKACLLEMPIGGEHLGKARGPVGASAPCWSHRRATTAVAGWPTTVPRPTD